MISFYEIYGIIANGQMNNDPEYRDYILGCNKISIRNLDGKKITVADKEGIEDIIGGRHLQSFSSWLDFKTTAEILSFSNEDGNVNFLIEDLQGQVIKVFKGLFLIKLLKSGKVVGCLQSRMDRYYFEGKKIKTISSKPKVGDYIIIDTVHMNEKNGLVCNTWYYADFRSRLYETGGVLREQRFDVTIKSAYDNNLCIVPNDLEEFSKLKEELGIND